MASAFESVILLQMSRYSPAAAKQRHIQIARDGLAEFMARQLVRPMVTIETDGNRATSEEQVKPFGIITYRFSRLREVVSYALHEAERLSPVKSGRYRRSWVVLAGNEEIGMDAIPNDVPVTLTNFQPYSRKINVGAKGFERYVPPGIVEKVRQLVLKRYRPVVDADIRYLTLANGHVLKRQGKRRSQKPGAAVTYPSLILTPKF